MMMSMSEDGEGEEEKEEECCEMNEGEDKQKMDDIFLGRMFLVPKDAL